jgi:hypothetical protein
MPTPSLLLAPALRAVVAIWSEAVRHYLRTPHDEYLHPVNILTFAVYTLNKGSAAQDDEDAAAFRAIDASPLSRSDIRGMLKTVLDTDAHLMATCRTPAGLARALQNLGLDSLARGITSDSTGDFDLDAITASLLERLFETQYRRGGLFHLYNLDLSEPELDLGVPGVRLVALNSADAAALTNETTTSSRIHYEGTGNAFLRFVDSGTDDEWQWLSGRWEEAYKFVRILRFLKCRVVDLDWGGIHYAPEWVNEIWKYGLTLIGRPRWDVQTLRFTLDAAEQEKLRGYIRFYFTHLGEIDDLTSPLRKATSIAGNYYESHHARTSLEDKLIDLVISAEALFSPSREGELKFRIAQRAALLLGADSDQRRRVMKLFRDAYDARSALVHGDPSPFETGKFTVAALEALGEDVRVAILRMVTLHMRGHRKRESVHAWLDDAALDTQQHARLIEESDFEKYVTEREQQNGSTRATTLT